VLDFPRQRRQQNPYGYDRSLRGLTSRRSRSDKRRIEGARSSEEDVVAAAVDVAVYRGRIAEFGAVVGPKEGEGSRWRFWSSFQEMRG
jgi:hypothetical protein